MKKTVFIKNAAILTASSLILRFAGIIFKVWLAAKIGAEGIGLYQLVFSVYMFAATFATSGICTAVTRLVSEELVIGSQNGVRRIVLRCVQISLVIAFFTIIILFFGANFIAEFLLKDARAALSRLGIRIRRKRPYAGGVCKFKRARIRGCNNSASGYVLAGYI